jgi:hypothetical protein
MVSVPGECTQQCAICGKPGKTVHKYKKDPDTGERICVVCGRNKDEEERKTRRYEKQFLLGFLGFFGLLGLGGILNWLAEEHWNFLMVLIVLVIVTIITAIVLWFRHLKHQRDIEILNINISKLGEDEAARRAEKYRDR